ncbi:hypothetical protein ACEXQE_02285 [Herbiconiux sp. P17]|uniref:hypothetical protein n=1 Tax=Herbiconiux wuyangfengii TaxID=3342794 RepID=UPI0035B92BE1
MSDGGPTTVGSIVAKLRIDEGEWDAKVAKAKTDAAEIGRLRPTITVETDAGGAVAGLAAVAAAADRASAANGRLATAQGGVTAAQSRLSQATTAAQIAWLRLDEVQGNAASTQRQLLSAHLAAERAESAQTRATNALTRATAELAAAEALDADQTQQLAVKKGLLATVQDRLTANTLKANEANRTSFTRIGMIGTAVALLLPLLPALGSFAIGAGGALTGMGAAGILAILGIRNEMRDGTAVGDVYSSGLSSLKGNLDSLSHTSAVAMLQSFKGVVRDTSGAMPFLNREVGEFAGLLGRSGGNLFSGALTGLRVLEPFLLRVGTYVEGLTAKFNAWTQNGGLQKFTSYAISQLPTVESMLGALANTVMHVLQALAPLGTVGLAALTTVSQVISAIPVQVLSDLIGVVTWGTLAFKAWGFIAPMISVINTALGSMGVAATVATGPIGWVVAGVAALAAILTVSAVNQQSAAAAVRDYTEAVTADSGAIEKNVKAKAIQALTDAGAYAAAKKLGIATSEVTKATLDGGPAQAQLMAKIKAGTAALEAAEKAQSAKTGTDILGVRATTNTKEAVSTLTDAVFGNNLAINQAVEDYQFFNTEMETATTTTANAADGYLAAAETVDGLLTKLEQLTDAVNKSNSVGQDAVTANASYQAAIAGVSEEVKRQQDAYVAANGTLDGYIFTLDESTAAGSANAQMFSDLASKSQEAAEKQFALDGNTQNYVATIASGRQTLYDNILAITGNADAAQALTDKVYAMPTQHEIEILASTQKASDSIDSIVSYWESRGITIPVYTINQDAAMAARGPDGQADGGTAGLADGGTGGGTVRGPGSAASDEAGLYRLANGEEVISNKKGQADKFRGVLKMMNAGFDVSAIADRMSLSAPARSTTITNNGGASVDQSRQITNHFTLNEVTNPAGTAAAIARRQQMLTV